MLSLHLSVTRHRVNKEHSDLTHTSCTINEKISHSVDLNNKSMITFLCFPLKVCWYILNIVVCQTFFTFNQLFYVDIF
uniref:Uncharacterized protein n=1 Tax=Anguilla anguilla TaxID=7936 RepID=A0A0E9X217_ANGAN